MATTTPEPGTGILVFDDVPIRSYLALEPDYQPDPKTKPTDFLNSHVRQLPPHLLLSFSRITTPKDRSRVSVIRNRRLKYASENPTWPLLYEGQGRRGQQEGEDERDWVANDFLQGLTKHVGKLGTLLGGYEEEREAERFRALRRERVEPEFVPEEESDSEDDNPGPEEMTGEDAKASFERLLRERFIYGLLEDIDYDKVDWDENLDADDDREAEERWFDEEDDEEDA
ncbi:hypothetical protein DFH06DRAFT_1161660 [Mycena polygramma]|nr:hypothetical protein DFH06DRAFT_1161660 [Mycena polygramma]